MDRENGTKIWQLFHRIMHIFRKHKPFPNLTESEARILFTINRYNHTNDVPINTNTLKDKLHVSSPTISQAVNQLAERDYVKRVTDEQDRRVTRIILSTKGEECFKIANDIIQEEFAKLATYLGEEKSLQLIEILEDVAVFYAKGDQQ